MYTYFSCPAIFSRISIGVRARDSRPTLQRSLIVTWRMRHLVERLHQQEPDLFLLLQVVLGEWCVLEIAFYYRHPRPHGRRDAGSLFIGLTQFEISLYLS